MTIEIEQCDGCRKWEVLGIVMMVVVMYTIASRMVRDGHQLKDSNGGLSTEYYNSIPATLRHGVTGNGDISNSAVVRHNITWL